MKKIDREYKSNEKLIPLTQWPNHHPWPTVSGLRYLVFHADKNGFADVVVRAGGRVLIHERRFFEWAEKNNTSVYGQYNGAS